MKFDSLIINANALIDLHSLEPTANTIIGIQDGYIRLVTTGNDYNQFKFNNLIDLKGKLLTPGLIDCHTHLVFAGSRAHEFKMRLEGISYAEIAKCGGGIKSTVTCTNQASFDELLTLAIKRVKIMQTHGVTTVEVKSGYGLTVDSEIKILEVAKNISEYLPVNIINTFLGAHAVPNEFSSSDLYIDHIINEMLPIIKERHLAEVVDAFCEKIAFSPTQIDKLFQAATKLGFRVKLHAEQLSNQQGAVLACKYNALSVDHLEYLASEDVVHLSNSKTVAVLLPGAFYFLKESKLPPIDALRKEKVPIAVGSDFNPGTSPFLSLPLIMNMACICMNLTIAEVWQGVTINAAKALGKENSLGSIELGKYADFAIWQATSPEMIVYSPTEYLCEGIIKLGKSV